MNGLSSVSLHPQVFGSLTLLSLNLLLLFSFLLGSVVQLADVRNVLNTCLDDKPQEEGQLHPQLVLVVEHQILDW